MRSLGSGLHPFEVASDEALDHARALGPALAAEAIAWVLDRFQPGGDHRQAERAADAAARLRLEPAAPALVRDLERLSGYDPVAHAAVRALEALVAVGQAILALDGELTRARRDRFGRAYARSDELLAEGAVEQGMGVWPPGPSSLQ